MRFLSRLLGVVGLLVLMVAIVAVLLARQYRRAYYNEKAARVSEASATADLFLSSAQDSLLKAGLAVNRANFEEAKAEMSAARKNLEIFVTLPLPKEVKPFRDFNTALTEIDVALTSVNPEVQKNISALADTVAGLRNSLSRSVQAQKKKTKP
ncbi:MAG: hypothetical protein V2A65_09425 [Candidatus Omnitrophota bacterium]